MKDTIPPSSITQQRVMRPDFAQEWITQRRRAGRSSSIPVSPIPPKTNTHSSSGSAKSKAGQPHWLMEDHMHRHPSATSFTPTTHTHHLHLSSPTPSRLLSRRQDPNIATPSNLTINALPYYSASTSVTAYNTLSTVSQSSSDLPRTPSAASITSRSPAVINNTTQLSSSYFYTSSSQVVLSPPITPLPYGANATSIASSSTSGTNYTLRTMTSSMSAASTAVILPVTTSNTPLSASAFLIETNSVGSLLIPTPPVATLPGSSSLTTPTTSSLSTTTTSAATTTTVFLLPIIPLTTSAASTMASASSASQAVLGGFSSSMTLFTTSMSSTSSVTSSLSSITSPSSSNAETISTGATGGVAGIGSAATATPSASSSPGVAISSGSKLAISPGAVAGSVVGGVAGLSVLLILLLLLVRLFRHRKQTAAMLPLSSGADPVGSVPSTAAASAAPFLPPVAAAFVSRMRSRPTSTATTGGQSFERLSGRKLPSQFSPGMEGPVGPGPFYPSGRSSAYLSGGTFASDVLAPQNPFADPPVRPGSSLGAGLGAGAIGAVTAATGSPRSERATTETAMPSSARTPVVHSRPNTARSSFLAAPGIPGTPSRGTLGRSHPSFDGSRGSRFTEDIV